MVVQRFPFILFREYPTYGYLSDNRNFGYDTASHSCQKVGDLLLSKTGSMFYAKLKETPQDINDVAYELNKLYPEVTFDTIKKDALDFYNDLSLRGFIFLGEEGDYQTTLQQYFSYGNKHPFELKISHSKNNQSTIEDTLGKSYNLTSVHIDISSRCNENCVHCYIPNSYKCSIMTKDMFVDIINQCRSLNVLNLTISGGEPMLNPSLKDFLSICRQYNFSVNLLTNLTLLSDELLEVISNNPLICVQTSLYAMDEKIHDSITNNQGSFRKTIKGIKILHERNVPLQINCPILKQNKDNYKDVLHFAESLNIEADADYLLFGSFDKSCSNLSCRISLEEIKNIEMGKYLKEKVSEEQYIIKHDSCDPICPVCKHSLCVSNNGDVYPCEGWQSFKVGNLKNQTLKEIWVKGKLVLQLRNLKYTDFPKCNICTLKNYCTFCLILNANEDPSGDYKNVNTYMCEVANIKANVQRNYIQ